MISFVIITNGKKDGILSKSIDRILSFDMPSEIIVVGKTALAGNFKYINFEENDDKGWITRKKNIGCEAAIYDILVVLHDDIILYENFAENILKLNFDEFDASGIKYVQGCNVFDWGYYGPLGHFTCCYDYSGEHCYIDGTAIVIKKNVFLNNKWDETLFINQSEDVELSHRLTRNGYKIIASPSLMGQTFGQGRCDRREFHIKGCSCED